MRKLIGFLLLGTAGLLAGIRAARTVAKRGYALEAIAQACVQIREAIAFAKMPLPQILRQLAESETAAQPFFAAVDMALQRGAMAETAWKQACSERAAELCLRSGEREQLRAVGTSLTSLNSEAAQQALTAAARQFERFAAEAAAERRNEERLRLTLWISAALMAGLLLL